MSQSRNTNQSVIVYTKAEPKPKFINSELQPYYDATDLEVGYVFDCCKALKPLKGIDVNEQQITFWYREFIRMGWKKKDFDKQFEAVKRATLYNRIDFEVWLKTEKIYNEIDFEIEVGKRINRLIERGKSLKNKEVILSEADKQTIDVALAKEYEFKFKNKYFEQRETYQQERRKEWEKRFQ
jgi:hypothetical protein